MHNYWALVWRIFSRPDDLAERERRISFLMEGGREGGGDIQRTFAEEGKTATVKGGPQKCMLRISSSPNSDFNHKNIY